MESTFRFVKHELSLEGGGANFYYQLQTPSKTYDFTEKISFPIPPNIQTTNYQLLNTTMNNLLLMLGISYYKLTCAKKIETSTINLNKKQANFWNIIYTKGLGEFFYKNKIDYREIINFPYHTVIPSPSTLFRANSDRDDKYQDRSLLLFGGGKDSIVSLEKLKEQNKNFDLFIVNPTDIHTKTAAVSDKKTIFFKRTLDPQLFELNKQKDFLNGHVPATAIIDFLAVFASVIYNYNHIVASNEKSANFGNVTYLGEEINHQWSKSLEFENLFKKYIHNFISPNITYYSILRDLDEIKITKIFSNYKKYFPYFSSCNNNFLLQTTNSKLLTTNRWCCKCPKCLFVFILLSAFLDKDELIKIFGKNLFQDKELLPLFKELLGIENFKPFECVGTPEEIKLALLTTLEKNEYNKDYLMEFFKEYIKNNYES